MASGMAALRLRQKMQEQKRKMGDDLIAETARQTEAALADFKTNLEAFALNQRHAIRSDPEFRSQFHAMCAHIGVDPLASNKSAVNKYLDFKDWSFASFYYELAVSVVEVCRATRPLNGGLIELRQLTELVTKRRGGAVDRVSADDVLQAVKKLQGLDRSFTVIPDPKKTAHKSGITFYVSSVPRELDTSFQAVFQAAHGKGYVAQRELAALPQWSGERATQALRAMLAEGVCLIDEGDPSGEPLYWFPAVERAAAGA